MCVSLFLCQEWSLYFAARTGDVDVIKRAIEDGCVQVNAIDVNHVRTCNTYNNHCLIGIF